MIFVYEHLKNKTIFVFNILVIFMLFYNILLHEWEGNKTTFHWPRITFTRAKSTP